MRNRNWFLVLTASVLISRGAIAFAVDPAPNPKNQADQKAPKLVMEALQSEAAGDLVERDRLLTLAHKLDNDCPQAQWQRGWFITKDGQWQSAEDGVAIAKAAADLSSYESQRLRAPDNANGQWELGVWCYQNDLFEQARAHLLNTLGYASNHVGARQLLGYRMVGGQWISPQQLERFAIREYEVRTGMEKYGKKFSEVARNLRARKAQVRADAREELMQINDPMAIAPLEAIIAPINSESTALVLEWLARVPLTEASLAMARIALSSTDSKVQQLSIAKLKDRPLHDFVPELLQMLSSPVAAMSVPVVGPDGNVQGFRQAFAQEKQGQTDVMVLDTRMFIDMRDTRLTSAAQDLATATESMENARLREVDNRAAATAQNEAIMNRNRGISRLLSEITNREFTDDPRELWNWWDATNETEYQSTKLASSRYQSTQLVTKYYSLESPGPRALPGQLEPRPYSGPAINSRPGFLNDNRIFGAPMATTSLQFECFARGTAVMTRKGLQSIETIRVGDLVLSRNVSSGELGWKSVVRTTTRPPRPLVEISLDNEKLRCTGGHLLWVSGKGWTKASQLQPGDILHAAAQPAVVMKLDQKPEEQTYNLFVDENQTYFVGKQLVLSHDVSDRTPTHIKVPGLMAGFSDK